MTADGAPGQTKRGQPVFVQTREHEDGSARPAATVLIGEDNLCVATKVAVPYFDCECGHRHEFADPTRQGRLLAGFATVHPKPAWPAVPFTEPLPGTESRP